MDMEARRERSRQVRYKKPIVKNLNFEFIKDDLWEIQEACEDVHWYTDNEDGTDTLVCAIGDESEAMEFKVMFADLCADVEQMLEDIGDTYVPECFDDLFVAIHGGNSYGGLLGWDECEQDYFGLDVPAQWAEEVSQKRIMRLSKSEMLDTVARCFKIYSSYIALRRGYDDLKASMDILRADNLGYIKTVKKIEELYDTMQGWCFDKQTYEAKAEWDMLLSAIPQEAWLY